MMSVLSIKEKVKNIFKINPGEKFKFNGGNPNDYPYASPEDIRSLLANLSDDTIKGLLRSIGDAGTTPTNETGETVLRRLAIIREWLRGIEERLARPSHAATFTTTPLGANATYTSNSFDNFYGRLGFIGALAFADQPSTTDGFMVEQSIDNSNWDLVITKKTVSANVGAYIKDPIVARYVRVKYINGGIAQTVFRLGGRFMIAWGDEDE